MCHLVILDNLFSRYPSKCYKNNIQKNSPQLLYNFDKNIFIEFNVHKYEQNNNNTINNNINIALLNKEYTKPMIYTIFFNNSLFLPNCNKKINKIRKNKSNSHHNTPKT